MRRTLPTWGFGFLLALPLGGVIPDARGADPTDGADPASAATRLVLVLRHAEKAAESADDPPLAPEGEERAREPARALGDCEVEGLVAADTRRSIAYDDRFIAVVGPPKITEVLHLKYGRPAR